MRSTTNPRRPQQLAAIGLAIATSLALSACGGTEFDPEADPTLGAGGKGDTRRGSQPAPAGIGTSPAPGGPVQLLAAGTGWKRLAVSGTFTDVDTGVSKAVAGDEVLVLTGQQGIAQAPLPQPTRDALLADLGLAVQQGVLPDAAHGLYFVHRATAEKIAASAPAGGTPKSCSNYTTDVERSTNFNEYLQYDKSFTSGAFSGAMAFEASLYGAVTGKLRLRVKRGSLFGICIPYAVGFVHVKIGGMASAGGRASVDGAFADKWSWDRQIAKPGIAEFWLSVGGVPVLLGFNAPVHVGLAADAKATLDVDAEIYGSGMFAYTCTSSGCDGSKSYSHSFESNHAPTIALNGRAKVRPWLQAAVRAYLYDDAIVRGQVGVRPYLEGDLWGYAGNTCGDGDGDGQNELVRALTLDADVGVELTAAVKIAGIVDKNWTWPLTRGHVGFWKIGEASAAEPMFWYSNVEKRFRGRMRPCWPYADAVSYRIDWQDGAQSTFSAAPASTFSESHSSPQSLRQTAELTAVSDAHGRQLNTTASATSGLLVPGEAASGAEYTP